MSMENILELQHVSKTFPKSNFTLEDVTFSLPYGAIMGFVGENGAGKTTTIGCIQACVKKLVLSTMVTIFPLTGRQSNYPKSWMVFTPGGIIPCFRSI